MNLSLALVEDFSRLFSGHMGSYGVHIEDENEVPDASGKKRGKNFTKQNPVTVELYTRHLDGAEGLGIVPVDQMGKCSFAVLDVDVYGVDHKPVLTVIKETGLPIVPFRSKSGGLHLYIFFGSPEKAARVVEVMTGLRILLMLDKKTEIFPKQAIVRPDESGNWINLPYFCESKTKQYAIGDQGEPLTLDEAVELAKRRSVSLETLESELVNLPLSDAPPCLQAVYLRKTTNNRNNYLMSLGTYYKAKLGDDFEFSLIEANNRLDNPIDIERLTKTVINSQKKRNYSYLCKEEPICSICYKDRCKKRKFGVGGDLVSELSYEEFRQYNTDPPFYEWVINGKSLKFYDERDIMGQQEFRVLCFRLLHILPVKLTDSTWTGIVNTALSNVIVKEIDPANDVSSGSIFMDFLSEFLTRRAPAMTKNQLLVDRVFFDTESDVYVFKPKVFYHFLVNTKNFKVYSATEVQSRLSTMGAMPVRYYISSEHSNVRLWTISKSALKTFIESPVDQVEVDFMEEMNNEPY